MISFRSFIILLSYSLSVLAVIRIQQFGAIPNSDTLKAQFINQKALKDALLEANKSPTDRGVLIGDKAYYSMPVQVEGLHNITITILGRWVASQNAQYWPQKDPPSKRKNYQDFISISKSSNIIINGGGRIDGRGYKWWAMSWGNNRKYMPPGSSRPHLITISQSRNIIIHDLILKNSPCFHLRTLEVVNATFYNLNIKVNTTAQINLFKRWSLQGIVPLFPLNTDGIDPAGRDFHIYNISCQNYDDVVVPKPTHASNEYTNCTQNMMIENITVKLGVGMSIGSVPPHDGMNCIRNITFRNVKMNRPFKGIYLKTNPGNSGTGLIENIYYQDITMRKPIWWAIYLGPQQQKQPDRGGPGCMLYPFDPRGTCATQPLVTIKNITLKNVRITKSLLFPIVMRCNQSNPCQDIHFDNVKIDKWHIGKKDKGYVCENVHGTQKDSKPKLDCLSELKNDNTNQLTQKDQEKVNLRDQQQLTNWEYRQLLNEMEKASIQIPYQDIDDQIDLTQDQQGLVFSID